MAKVLNGFDVSMICLQEIQQNAYVPLMASNLKNFPYQAFENHVYAPKGGLMTFSRIPIKSHSFIPYKDRGHWWSLGFADWALYKGVLITKVQIGKRELRVLNTHLHANYRGSWRQNNGFARIQHNQVNEVLSLVDSQPQEALVVLCGDFNFPRSAPPYQELLSRGNLVDPLAADGRPTYRPFPLVSSKWSMPLDYLLVRVPPRQEVQIIADILPIENVQARRLNQRFLTDHYALTLQIEWEA